MSKPHRKEDLSRSSADALCSNLSGVLPVQVLGIVEGSLLEARENQEEIGGMIEGKLHFCTKDGIFVARCLNDCTFLDLRRNKICSMLQPCLHSCLSRGDPQTPRARWDAEDFRQNNHFCFQNDSIRVNPMEIAGIPLLLCWTYPVRFLNRGWSNLKCSEGRCERLNGWLKWTGFADSWPQGLHKSRHLVRDHFRHSVCRQGMMNFRIDVPTWIMHTVWVIREKYICPNIQNWVLYSCDNRKKKSSESVAEIRRHPPKW